MAVTKYVSLGSILSSGIFSIRGVLASGTITDLAFYDYGHSHCSNSSIMKHHGNIKRLMNGHRTQIGKQDARQTDDDEGGEA